MKLIFKKSFFFIRILLLFGVLIGFSTLVMQLGMDIVFRLLGIPLGEDFLYAVSGSLGVAVAAVLLCAMIQKKKNWSFVETKENFSLGRAVTFAVFAMCSLKIIYSFLFITFFGEFTPPVIQERLEEPILQRILLSVILAPITEEILFRKGFYSLLRGQFSMVTAVGINALIFALIHGYQIQGFFSCLLAGILYSLIYEKTGNIWYSIGAHMLCNVESMVGEFLEEKGIMLFGSPLVYSAGGGDTYHVVVVVAAVVLSIILVKIIKRGNENVQNTCCG